VAFLFVWPLRAVVQFGEIVMTAKSNWFAKLIWALKRRFGITEREQCHVERDDHEQRDRGVFAI
jgi:hypothetical protein